MAGLRDDFAALTPGLVMPQQKSNLQRLHDELVDRRSILPQERAMAATNYQQGRFMRLPGHVLVVTMARLAYTHDGGVRFIPLNRVDLSSVRSSSGIAHGELSLSLLTGEQLTFRKGASLLAQEVAATLAALHGAGGQHVPTPPDLLDEWGQSEFEALARDTFDGTDDLADDGVDADAWDDSDWSNVIPASPSDYLTELPDFEIDEAHAALWASPEGLPRHVRAKLAPLAEGPLTLPRAVVYAKPVAGRVFAELHALPDGEYVRIGLLNPEFHEADLTDTTIEDEQHVTRHVVVCVQPDDPQLFYVLADIEGAPPPWPGAWEYSTDLGPELTSLWRIPDGADTASTLAGAVGALLGPGTWIAWLEAGPTARSVWAREGSTWTESQ